MAQRDLSIRLSVKDKETVTAALKSLGAEGAAALEAIEKAAVKSTSALSKEEKELEKLKNQLDPTAKAAAQFAKAQEVIAAASARGAITHQQAMTMMAAANQKYVGEASKVTAATQAISAGVSKTTGLVLKLGAVLGVVGFVEFIKSAYEYAGGLGEVAEQLGVTTEAVQAYHFAAVQGGVKIEEVNKSVMKFTRTLGEAAEGEKTANEAFDKLGIKILDANKKVRDTDTVLQEAAQKLLAIEDPAKRAAAAADLFGKSGQKLLPMLGDLAKGTKGLFAEAKEAGFGISKEAIDRLDKFGDFLERVKLAALANGAELFAKVLFYLDEVEKWFNENWPKIQNKAIEIYASAAGIFQGIIEVGQHFAETLANIIAKAFVDGFNEAIKVINATIAGIEGILAEFKPKEGSDFTSFYTDQQGEVRMIPPGRRKAKVNLGRIDPMTGPSGSTSFDVSGVFNRAMERQRLEILRRRGLDLPQYTNSWENFADPDKPPPKSVTPGVNKPNVKGGEGEKIQERIDKLKEASKLELQYAKMQADAAKIGQEAVSDLEDEYKAAKAAQKAYGKTAKDNTENVKKLTAELKAQAQAIGEMKALKDLRLGTQELERQNEIIMAQIRLADAPVEQRAREIAYLKVRNELANKGIDISKIQNDELQKEVDRRVETVTKQEMLNDALEKSKKNAELWAKPFENAIQSMQGQLTDFLQQVFSGGIQSWSQLSTGIKGIWHRLMAELASMAIIRPVIQFAVQGAGALGFLPNSIVQQFGGTSGGVVQINGQSYIPQGGGGIGGLPIGGMGGGLDLRSLGLGGVSDFLNTQVYGGSELFGPPLPGQTMGTVGGITYGNMLSGALGLGLGALQLGQGNTFGGIAGIASGIMSFIPGLAPFAPIVGLLGGLLGGLLKKKLKSPQGVANLVFSNGQFNATQAMSRGKGGFGDQAIKLAGGLGDAISDFTSGYGLDILEGAPQLYFGTSQGKKTGRLFFGGFGPYSGGEEVAIGSDQADIIGQVAAAFIKRAANTGTLGGLTATQRSIFASEGDLSTLEAIKKALDFSKIYDDVVRGQANITSAEKAVRELNDQFRTLTLSAKEYGLDVTVLETRRREAIEKMATDINDDVRRRRLSKTPEGQLQLALEDLDKAKEQAIKEAQYLNDTIRQWGGTLVDINALEAQYGQERLDIIEEFNKQATEMLQDLWKRLTYGDLSGAAPVRTLAGAEAEFNRLLAEAPNSIEARQSLAQAAEDYIAASLQFSGNDPRTEAIREYIRQAIAPYMDTTTGTTGQTASTSQNATIVNQNNQIQALTALVTSLTDQIGRLIQRMNSLGITTT